MTGLSLTFFTMLFHLHFFSCQPVPDDSSLPYNPFPSTTNKYFILNLDCFSISNYDQITSIEYDPESNIEFQVSFEIDLIFYFSL